jgi:hypothetical protein
LKSSFQEKAKIDFGQMHYILTIEMQTPSSK